MGSIKMLCLGLTAGCLAFAIFGAGPAAATSLCMVEAETCSEAFEYPTGSEYHLHLKEGATVQTGIATCTASVMVDALLEPGTPLLDEVSDTNYAGCFSSLTKCGEEIEHLPITSEVEASTSTLSLKRGGGELEWLVVCGPVECKYGAKKVDFKVEGGEPATAAAEEQKLTLLAGPLPECSLHPTFSAEYVFDEVTLEGETIEDPPLYITE